MKDFLHDSKNNSECTAVLHSEQVRPLVIEPYPAMFWKGLKDKFLAFGSSSTKSEYVQFPSSVIKHLFLLTTFQKPSSRVQQTDDKLEFYLQI